MYIIKKNFFFNASHRNRRRAILLLIIFSQYWISCKKDYLDAKPKSSIVVPETIEDLKAIIANVSTMGGRCPNLGLLASDEFYFLNDGVWAATINPIERYAYIWQDNPYQGVNTVLDWSAQFTAIYYSNIVLEAVAKLEVTQQNKNDINEIYANALFYRAFCFHNLMEVFCLPYKTGSTEANLGLPLRSTPSIDEILPRSSNKTTYEFIISDLKRALTKAVDNVPNTLTYKSPKCSIYGLLARVHLNSGDYQKAELYADSALMLYNKLIDYNTLDANSTNPFVSLAHDEMMFRAISNIYTSTFSGALGASSLIDSSLYKLYEITDLRKSIFFLKNSSGNINIKTGYQATNTPPFAGIATDEIYLIKSETAARNGNLTVALTYLNRLLKNRFKPGYQDYTTTDKDTLIGKILLERRKELVFRNLRWQDLRRLSFIENKGIRLYKRVNNTDYYLEPKSNKYAFPIPPDEIAYSGIEQNPR